MSLVPSPPLPPGGEVAKDSYAIFQQYLHDKQLFYIIARRDDVPLGSLAPPLDRANVVTF